MPLAATFSLQWYGPECAALMADPGVGDMPVASPNKITRAGVTGVGTGDAPILRPYRMRNFELTVDAGGDAPVLAPNKEIRAGLTVKVSELSQDDVVGAVQQLRIEGDITLVGALRLLLSQAAGDGATLKSTPKFNSMDGSKTRIESIIDSDGNRTITKRDVA